MQNRRTTNKSALFLMELIIAVGFFAFASAICMQLFAKAHLLSSRSANTTMAISVAQNAAESFKGTADPTAMADLLGGSLNADNDVVVHYSPNWERLPSRDGARFMLIASADMEKPLKLVHITVTDTGVEDGILFEIAAKKYAATDQSPA